MPTKPWYQSKAIWAGILAVVFAAYNAFRANLGPALPPVPEFVYGLLGAFGIYGRASATTVVTR